MTEHLNESSLKKIIDYTTAFRIVRMLWLPWDKQKAFQLGLIDADGNKLKDAKSDEELAEMTPLVNLVFKLKRILQKVPAGGKLGSLAAAYAMLKEQCVQEGVDGDVLDELFSAYTTDLGIELNEEAPVNVAGGVASHTAPATRNRWKDLPKIAGSHTFEVESDLFDKVKMPKEKGASWDSHLDDGEVSQKIKQFAKTYPTKPIMLRRAGQEHYQWLRK